MSSKTVTLKVNDVNIPLSFFVQTYFDRVMDGIIGSLENTGSAETLMLEGSNNSVALTVNGLPVAMNEFVRQIVRKTAEGMISSLRGIEKIDTFNISVVTGK
ncbi:hypothetical protein Dform_00786 [Dehalogenimonas formicexedens]|uniref:Uncharacterized protein n=1 Tax=Dehalogenimonas formicexedens TaxID=1839801 RepID=A0A1P8F6M5_9CHLR|nr:hypothetical protein [Dehalogenimonas formicexedens]APV44136.1 hypothetical protein Dform_00786 [Dehalogenimonas formicexedens]